MVLRFSAYIRTVETVFSKPQSWQKSLVLERSPVFLRPSVKVESETGAMGFFLCLCVLMAILPFLVILSKRKSNKIIAVLLPGSEDTMRTFACTHSVKSHHDLTRLSLPGVMVVFCALQFLSYHFLTCCSSMLFILCWAWHDVYDHVFICRYLFAIFLSSSPLSCSFQYQIMNV